jgi:uncharacterized protein (TIGR00661 family)
MARILYGVQGDAHGHAIRALTIARHYPEHDFLFVSYDHGARLLRQEFPVFECPGLETFVHNHRLDSARTILGNLQFFSRERRHLARVVRLAEEFKPDVAISDYEYFVPRACRSAGVACLSLDHQHTITACFHRVPPRQLPSYLATYLAVRCLFSSASWYLVTSFFRPAAGRNQSTVEFVPPLLRERVIQAQPETGDHVVAYRSHPPSDDFLPFLKKVRRPVMLYGFNAELRDGNLQFMKRSEEGFLQALASCSYVICSGGHTLMSEALYLGKPILSFPIDKLFEQYLNAFYLEQLGYGKHFEGYGLKTSAVPAFEAQLDQYRTRIKKGTFCGNEAIFSLLDYFIRNKELPSARS